MNNHDFQRPGKDVAVVLSPVAAWKENIAAGYKRSFDNVRQPQARTFNQIQTSAL